MNLFRCTPDKSLDKQYLRVCAVYRLMDRKGLGKEQAVALLKARKVQSAQALVENWLAWPLSEKGRRQRAQMRTQEAA